MIDHLGILLKEMRFFFRHSRLPPQGQFLFPRHWLWLLQYRRLLTLHRF